MRRPNSTTTKRAARVEACLRILVTYFALLTNGQGAPVARATEPADRTAATEKDAAVGTHADRPSNVHTISDSILSGGQPSTEDHFRWLADQGVKVIVSVDATRPDLTAASRHSIRYVHIPIGYDGVDTNARNCGRAVAELAAQRVYVHCHHGRHRGPTMAVLIAMASGQIDRREALRWLRSAGTDPAYDGLWKAVRQFDPADPTTPLAELVAHVEPVGMTESMVQLQGLMDRIDEACEYSDPPHSTPKRSHIDHRLDASRKLESAVIQVMQVYRETVRLRRQRGDGMNKNRATNKNKASKEDNKKSKKDSKDAATVAKPDCDALECDASSLTVAFETAESEATAVLEMLRQDVVPPRGVVAERLRHACVECHDRFRGR